MAQVRRMLVEYRHDRLPHVRSTETRNLPFQHLVENVGDVFMVFCAVRRIGVGVVGCVLAVYEVIGVQDVTHGLYARLYQLIFRLETEPEVRLAQVLASSILKGSMSRMSLLMVRMTVYQRPLLNK